MRIEHWHDESVSKADSALSSIDCGATDYDTWKNIGIAYKMAGGTLGGWLDWCMTDMPRYDERAATRLYNKAEFGGSITEATLYGHARKSGWAWYEADEPVQLARQDVSTLPAWEQCKRQLESLFFDEDYVCIVTRGNKGEDGKWRPLNSGSQYLVGDLVKRLEFYKDIESCIGAYDHECGVWFRINPTDGDGGSDSNVTAYRHALVESDTVSIDEQLRIINDMNLPVVSIAKSGGKSVHAIVRIDADGRNHYADRVRTLHRCCNECGLDVDQANKNPSRLSRLAGCMRDGVQQSLVSTSGGARDYQSWERAYKRIDPDNVKKPNGPHKLDLVSTVHLARPLIDGVLRKGHKMSVVGASKSYKSFALIELAIALASGTSWLGFPCAQCKVLYLNCEIDSESFRKRFIDVSSRTGIPFDVLQENIDVWDLRGMCRPIDQMVPPIVTNALEGQHDIIVIDPIYKLIDGDENASDTLMRLGNSLDRICRQTGSALVFCHHQSKGAQGDKRAIDRANGSGVLGRDVDAHIDVSPLVLTDDFVPPLEFEDATAWRIEATVRDFKPTDPFDCWFKYPLHYVDEDGDLADMNIASAAVNGGKKSGEVRKKAADDRVTQLENIITLHGERTVSDLARIMECSKKSVRNYAQRSEILTVENGVVSVPI